MIRCPSPAARSLLALLSTSALLALCTAPGAASAQSSNARPSAEPPLPPGQAYVDVGRPSVPDPEAAARAARATDVGEHTGTLSIETVLRGEGRGLSAERAAALAVATAPSIDRARAAVRQAQAGANRALYGFIPQLSISARYTRLSEIQNGQIGGLSDEDLQAALTAANAVSDPVARALWTETINGQANPIRFPVILDQYSFQFALTYPVSDVFLQVLPSYEASNAATRAQRHQLEVQAGQVALQARQAYYSYAQARGALAIAQASAEQAESRQRQIAAFVDAGSAPRVDLLRVNAQAAAAQVAVARARAGVAVAETALRTLLHLPGDQSIAVADDVLAPLPSLETPVEQLYGQALDRRAEVRALRELIEAQGHAVDAAEGSRWPHLVVAANLDVSNPQQRIFPQVAEFRESWNLAAVVSWSPHDLLNGEARASEARAQADQARADLQALEDALRLQVTQAHQSFLAERAALEAARVGLQAADESYRVRQQQFEAGAAVLSDVVDAQADQIRAQLDLVTAAINARVAWAQLQRAIGAEDAAVAEHRAEASEASDEPSREPSREPSDEPSGEPSGEPGGEASDEASEGQ